jgi:outer membrane protein assembly factor BamB
VVARRASRGKVVWRKAYRLNAFQTERLYSSVPVSRGAVFVGSVGGYVYSLDADNGHERWRFKVNGGYVYATPAIADARVFVGDYGGTLYALKQGTGKKLWSTSVGGPISGSPVVIGHNVYVSTLKPGRTFAFNVETGRKTWTSSRGRYVPGIATSERIYLSQNGYLSAWVSRQSK